MPQIPVYQDQVAAQGSLNVGAVPDAFGAGIADGMAHLGGALGVAGDTLYQMEKQREAKEKAAQETEEAIHAYNVAGEAEIRMAKWFDERVKSVDLKAPDAKPRIESIARDTDEQFTKEMQAALATAKTDNSRKLITRNLMESKQTFTRKALGSQSGLTGAWAADGVTTGLKRSQDVIAADPSNDSARRQAATFDRLTEDAKSLDPEVRAKLRNHGAHELAVTQVDVLKSTNFRDFLRNVNPQGGSINRTGRVVGAVPGGKKLAAKDAMPFIFAVESGGRQVDADGNPLLGAVIQKGDYKGQRAVGIGQVMPGNGPAAAELAGVEWDEAKFRTDKDYNAKLATAIYSEGLSAFNGDVLKAAAAYNGGAGQVKAAVKAAAEAGTSDWTQFLKSDETKDYVKKIAAEASKKGVDLSIPSASSVPELVPLTDQQIAESKPDIWGWEHLTWAEKVKAVREAEGMLAHEMAAKRGEFKFELKDTMAALQHGEIPPGVEKDPKYAKAYFMAQFGDEAGAAAHRDFQAGLKFARTAQIMKGKPPEQLAAMVEGLKPKAGTPGYADAVQYYEMAGRAAEQEVKAQREDFIAYQKQASPKSIQPLDMATPEAFEKSLRQRVPMAVAGADSYGAPNAGMDKNEMAALAGFLGAAKTADQAQYIGAIRKATEGYDWMFDRVVGKLDAHNPTLAYAANVVNKKGSTQTAGGPVTASQVSEAILGGDAILKGHGVGNDKDENKRGFDFNEKKFASEFWNAVGADAYVNADPVVADSIRAKDYHAVKCYVVYQAAKQNKRLSAVSSDDVRDAAKAVLGETVYVGSHGDRVFAPWGANGKSFQAQFGTYVDKALQENGLKGSPLDAPDGFRYANADDGRYYIMHKGRPLVNPATGRNVVVDTRGATFDAPAKTPTSVWGQVLGRTIPGVF